MILLKQVRCSEQIRIIGCVQFDTACVYTNQVSQMMIWSRNKVILRGMHLSVARALICWASQSDVSVCDIRKLHANKGCRCPADCGHKRQLRLVQALCPYAACHAMLIGGTLIWMCACNTGGGSDYISPNETSLDEISSDQPWAHAADEEISELRSCSATRTNERQ